MQNIRNKHLWSKCQINIFQRFYSIQNKPVNKITQEISQNPLTERKIRLEKIGNSLQIYLNNVKNYTKNLENEEALFETGKRHLANIMGWSANVAISQEEIDKAIQYLFPTGLHDKLAQPVFKSPREILPKMNKLEFDEEYRPKGHLFYTINGKFYSLLSNINYRTQSLIQKLDEQRIKKKNIPEEDLKNRSSEICLPGSNWITKEELMKKIDQIVTDDMYTSFVMSLDYLVSLPMAYQHKNFIMEYRTSISTTVAKGEAKKIFGPDVPQVQYNTEGRFATAMGYVKKTRINVKVTDPGTGNCTIDGLHYSIYRSHLQKEIIITPLIITGLLGKVDIEAIFIDGNYGETIIPRAIRHGTSLSLAALYPEFREKLRLAGLLTRDIRKKERSKINQPGARAKWIWKKR